MDEPKQPVILKYFLNAIKMILPRNIDGEGLLLAHFFTMLWLIIILLLGNINTFFYFLFIIWLLIVSAGLYLRTCVLTEIERELFKNNEWEGPLGLILSIILKPIGPRRTRNLINDIIVLFAILITLFIIFKITYLK